MASMVLFAILRAIRGARKIQGERDRIGIRKIHGRRNSGRLSARTPNTIRNKRAIPTGKRVRNSFIFLTPPSVATISIADVEGRTMIEASEMPFKGFSLVLLMPGPVTLSSYSVLAVS
jgi:hypothetical protein